MSQVRRGVAASIVLVLALAFAGCSWHGGEVRSISVDGIERTYRVHVPERLADDPALVVMMHGGGGSAKQAERGYGWDAVADREGFVVAYPNGENRTWNAGSCCGAAERNGHDDVAFIVAMTVSLQDEFGVDGSRTFASGMSNGAMMAYRLACESTAFAAIAPVAGTLMLPCDDPAPVSLIAIHGLADDSVPYDGSPGSGVGRVDGMAVPETVDIFRAAGDCDEPKDDIDPPVTTSTSNCPEGRQVVLVTIEDSVHRWPGAQAHFGEPEAGREESPLDATELIWDFFEDVSLPA